MPENVTDNILVDNDDQVDEVVRKRLRPIKLKRTWLAINVGLNSILEAINVSWQARKIPPLWDIIESPDGA